MNILNSYSCAAIYYCDIALAQHATLDTIVVRAMTCTDCNSNAYIHECAERVQKQTFQVD